MQAEPVYRLMSEQDDGSWKFEQEHAAPYTLLRFVQAALFMGVGRYAVIKVTVCGDGSERKEVMEPKDHLRPANAR